MPHQQEEQRTITSCSPPLVMGHASIHVDRLAGNEVTGIRSQKHHCPGQVRWFLIPLDNLHLQELSFETGYCLWVRYAQRRLGHGVTGGNGVDVDPRARELSG